MNTSNIKLQDGHPLVIGLLHAKWCGHCQTLLPVWGVMKQNIDSKVHRHIYQEPKYMEIEHANIGELDRFNNENQNYLANKIEYEGFPTIFKIHNGNVEYYQQDRYADPMEKWFMQDQYQPTEQSVVIIKKHKKQPKKSKKHKKQTKKSKKHKRRNI